MFIVQSEFDGDIFVAQVETKLEALASARNQGLLGVLNAAQVQDKVQALDRIRAAVKFALDTFGPKRVPFCLPDGEMRKLGNGDIVLDFSIGIWTFTLYPNQWRVCNT